MSFGKLLGGGQKLFSSGRRHGGLSQKQKCLSAEIQSREKILRAAPAKEPGHRAAAPAAKPAAPRRRQDAQNRPAVAPPGPCRRAPSWTEKLNPFRGSAPARQAATSAVQAELSLDTVKVVHNDLSDADVEVVPVKSRPKAAGCLGRCRRRPSRGNTLGEQF